MTMSGGRELRVAQELRQLVNHLTGFHGELGIDDNLLERTGFNSIQLVLLVAELEARFGIRFGADIGDFKALTSLRTLAQFVAVRQS